MLRGMGWGGERARGIGEKERESGFESGVSICEIMYGCVGCMSV